MEQWQDQAIVLSVRGHGENGAIVTVLTEQRGKHAGFVQGARSSKMRGVLEAGNSVDVRWQSRISENLGSFVVELNHNPSANILSEPLKLSALQSVCALCDAALPEREAHTGLYHGTLAVFDSFAGEAWGAAYIIWEIAFLRELGFSLDLTRCAAGSDDADLCYVSPKTGRAVSRSAGEPYKEKLLPLPAFISPAGGEMTDEAILDGLKMTGHFLEHWAFTHHTSGIPEARLRFADRFAKTIHSNQNA